MTSAAGGGSLPGETLPGYALALVPGRTGRSSGNTRLAATLARRLRLAPLPVVARVAEGRVVLDPRTVLPEQEEDLIAAVKAALAAGDEEEA